MEKNIKKKVCIYMYECIQKSIYILLKEYIYITESLCCTDTVNTITLNQLYFNLINKQRLSLRM